MLLVRFLAVDVVDLAVEGVGGENGSVQGAIGHGVRAQQDVGSVPKDGGEGGEEPEEGDGGWGVSPAAFAGGARGASEGFGGGGEVGWGKGGGVVAGGDHDLVAMGVDAIGLCARGRVMDMQIFGL